MNKCVRHFERIKDIEEWVNIMEKKGWIIEGEVQCSFSSIGKNSFSQVMIKKV